MTQSQGVTREPLKRVTPALMAAVPAELLEGRPHTLAADQVEVINESFERNGDELTVDANLLSALFEEGLSRGYANDETDNFALDQWLAPRLHLALRLPRRVASDQRFWAWIAMRFGHRYVFERFEDGDGTVSAWRFTGDLLRNAVSRLWWTAELLRNGPDYTEAMRCLRRVVTGQYALELKYSWFRPAAIAFVKIAEGSSPPLTLETMKELSKRANIYLPLMPIEALGYDDEEEAFDVAWWTGSISREELLGSELPKGPTDGSVSEESVETVQNWYAEVLGELGKSSDGGVDETAEEDAMAPAAAGQEDDA